MFVYNVGDANTINKKKREQERISKTKELNNKQIEKKKKTLIKTSNNNKKQQKEKSFNHIYSFDFAIKAKPFEEEEDYIFK